MREQIDSSSMSDKWRFCLAEVVAVFIFFWVRVAGTATAAVGTSAPASFDNFLLFIGTGGGAKGFLEVFAMGDRVIAEM